MSRWWTPKRVRITRGGVLLATVVAFVLLRNLDEIIKWTSILGFFVALCSLLLSITSREHQDLGPGLVQRLDQATEDLAAAVQQQWRAEERLRRVQDPFPLPVRWAAADAVVTDRWVHLRQSAAELELGGRLEQVMDVFCRVPSERLVVLGKPGAGKTVLTLRFTLDYLARRQPQDRVPVIFPLASWNPGQQSLQAWMAERLGTDYPALSALAPSGSSWAWELVGAGRVLPVLDGLDEIPAPLRNEAMRHLNLALDHDAPVLVTCRTEEYRFTVQGSGVFARASVVELLPLTLDDLADYLPRTIHQSQHDGSDPQTTKWEPVLACLQENIGQPAARTVLEVLCTPLMTSMARVAYSDTRADPAHLLDERFADPAEVEQHLLDGFIPAAYSYLAPSTTISASAGVQYRPGQAREWLRFMALHLHQLGTRDVTWWQQAQAVPRLNYGLLVGLSCGLAFGLVGALAGGPMAGLAYGIAFGLAGGITSGLSQPSEPSRVEIRFRGTTKPFVRRFTVGLVTGVALGLAFPLPYEGALALGLAFGLAVGLHVWLDVPADATQVSSPRVVLMQDRTATLVFALSFAFPFGITYGATFLFSDKPSDAFGLPFELPFGLAFVLPFGLAGAVAGGVAGILLYRRVGGLVYSLMGTVVGGLVLPPVHSVALGLVLGLLFGLAVGYVAILSRAWGVFVLSQMWLSLRGHQPWRLVEFLEDAHRRGVLRQAGGVYQFRHARLQDHLAERNLEHQAQQTAHFT